MRKRCDSNSSYSRKTSWDFPKTAKTFYCKTRTNRSKKRENIRSSNRCPQTYTRPGTNKRGLLHPRTERLSWSTTFCASLPVAQFEIAVGFEKCWQRFREIPGLDKHSLSGNHTSVVRQQHTKTFNQQSSQRGE